MRIGFGKIGLCAGKGPFGVQHDKKICTPLAQLRPGDAGRHTGLFNLFGLKQREGDPPLFQPQGMGGIHKRNTGPESTQAETRRITEGMAKN